MPFSRELAEQEKQRVSASSPLPFAVLPLTLRISFRATTSLRKARTRRRSSHFRPLRSSTRPNRLSFVTLQPRE